MKGCFEKVVWGENECERVEEGRGNQAQKLLKPGLVSDFGGSGKEKKVAKNEITKRSTPPVVYNNDDDNNNNK